MWKWWHFYCILLHLCARSLCQKTALDSSLNVILFRIFRNWGLNAFGTSEQSAQKHNSHFCYILLIMVVGKIVSGLEDFKIFYVHKYV